MKYLLICVIGIVLTGCARSKVCKPSHFWACVEQEISKNSCLQLTTSRESIKGGAGQTCLNRMSEGLSADQQETCKQKLRDDL